MDNWLHFNLTMTKDTTVELQDSYMTHDSQ